MLDIKNLHVSYGGIRALQGISLHVPEGKIISLLGANGAGKSTTLRTIMGIVKPTEGSIEFLGGNILGMKSFQVVMKGIALVPEGRRVFTNLTVTENLALGAYTRNDKVQIQQDIEEIYELFPRLREREKQSAGTLSGGEQQMLALGRALMSKPKLLMIDEPSLGLAPVLSQGVLSRLKELNQTRGQTILLIEQNARAALSIADYAYILETGRITLEGPAAELATNDAVRKTYLGIH
ncbi:MAG TPA: ABC transporter ATP-binding protein [Anaerolineaceae bacterium]|jgi:branched-chain amino acid transport system ATP-binding protein|nr:ABC transporter ATP-binding protein [Anaerolineaceae bacterium]HNZ02128.1 ABC transporter ATP-binding protein [Anaerolineaceae bacterium]HOH21393.1 ABC transporter ATP-binding protein [Anaerolineaceae bacterium]HOU45340.1 ABC transporter ATP-binding protein [Anaerolineaceae bacterium]HPA34421.1 ABC transporter ATP-binding protein [Anaerolineaceae bacterium]